MRAILQHLTDAVRQGANTSLKIPTANQSVHLADMMQAARNDDPLVTKVLARTVEYVGRTICQVNQLLNPELIVIAGPLAELDHAFLQPFARSSND